MVKGRRLCGPAAAALAAGVVLAGCGGSTHHATKPYVVSFPGLGTITDTCAPNSQVRATFDASQAPATETVSVEGDGRQHLRAATLNPPPHTHTLAAPVAGYHELTWRVVQNTEPHTIVETVVQQFSGCTVTSSTPRVRVISHAGPSTPPSEWA